MISVVVADPPWQFSDKLPGKTRGAERQYKCIPALAICQMAAELPDFGRDAVLFLWRVASMQQEALDVARAWGFTVKSELVWQKQTKRGLPYFGMGRYFRGSHETCLLCVRGKAPPAVHNVRSRFVGKVRAHSQKPDEFFGIVEQLYPLECGPHYELFARSTRPGWIQLGDELGKLDCAVES